MRFTPKTKEELQAEDLLPDGEYDFECIEGKDDKSKKSGADMIVVNLKVFGQNGRLQFVRDYLLESMGVKLRNFCEATGLLGAYDAGALEGPMCFGRTGRAKIGTEKGRKNPQTGEEYPPKNTVRDYIVSGSDAPSGGYRKANTPTEQVTDDGEPLPF